MADAQTALSQGQGQPWGAHAAHQHDDFQFEQTGTNYGEGGYGLTPYGGSQTAGGGGGFGVVLLLILLALFAG